MNNKKIKVGIIGSAGYTGGELIRLLLQHPNVVLTCLHSNSHANKTIYTVHKDLKGDTELCFTNVLSDDNIEVLFLCLGHGDAIKFLQTHHIPDTIKIIDLSHDFRINNIFNNKIFTYGLPEIYKKEISNATNIVNPGCFATALQLSLLPIIKEKINVTFNSVGITGATGAGQSLQASSHFTWRANNISAYKTLTHQHLNEISVNFKKINPSFLDQNLNFVPWRGDFTRGIFISTIFNCNLINLSDIKKMYQQFYQDSAFTFLIDNTLDLKQVINTNKCFIQIENMNETFVIHVAIDNLIKGASGQAIQNMNIMCGIDEKVGLNIKNIAF